MTAQPSTPSRRAAPSGRLEHQMLASPPNQMAVPAVAASSLHREGCDCGSVQHPDRRLGVLKRCLAQIRGRSA